MSATDMVCVLCGKRKAYPDGFPDRAIAECWQCVWERHVRHKHPEVVRRVRREVKKRARRMMQRDVEAAATERELALIRREAP